MEYRIVEKDAFRLAGVMARVPMHFEGENPAIAELARDITGEQRAEMNRLMDTEPRRVVNASWNSDTNFQEEAGELTHLIGVPTIARSAGEGLALVEVPALTWAVFPNDGQHPETMQQTTARIYAECLPRCPGSSTASACSRSATSATTVPPTAKSGCPFAARRERGRLEVTRSQRIAQGRHELTGQREKLALLGLVKGVERMALPSHERLDDVVDKCLSLSRYNDCLVMPTSRKGLEADVAFSFEVFQGVVHGLRRGVPLVAEPSLGRLLAMQLEGIEQP